ncbi:MAG: carbon-nitrogen hydrolase family protein [Candidatus Rokubacteria bacterium]|nr:carbon-nitrogen hydrolase family protein [Candidatus Rokubacteria bacterium]
MTRYPAYKVAVAHVAPVFLDLAATVEKTCGLLEEAARHDAQLVAFPETYIPAFPVWSALRAPIYNHDLFRRLAANSIRCPGPELAQIASVARRLGIVVSLGFNEISPASVGCIWNSNVLIGDDGTILNHHRKLVPTFFEKLTWANGDGAGLRVADTRLGRVGMLICGENTNPLARFTLMAQGEQVHVSTYPAIWPTRDPKEGGNYNLANAIRIRAGAHSFEAKAFNVVASGFMDSTMREALADLTPDASRILDASPRGVSMVLGPTGEPVGEVLSDTEGLLYAQVDIAACVEPKQIHDVVGYYNRFDIFKLTVDRSANRPITFVSGAEAARDGLPSGVTEPEGSQVVNVRFEG